MGLILNPIIFGGIIDFEIPYRWKPIIFLWKKPILHEESKWLLNQSLFNNILPYSESAIFNLKHTIFLNNTGVSSIC